MYRFMMGKPEGKRQLRKPRLRWENNIKMDLQEVGWGHGVDLCGSGQGQMWALVNAVMNFRVP
jgi:hypothetical protein